MVPISADRSFDFPRPEFHAEVERRSLQTTRSYQQLAGEIAGLWSAAHGLLEWGVVRVFKLLSARRKKAY